MAGPVRARAFCIGALSLVLGGCHGIAELGDERTRENERNRCTKSGEGVAWAAQYGDASNQTISSLSAGPGGVYLTGNFDGALDLGKGALVSAGHGDVFLARFDSDGHALWSRSFGDDGDQNQTLVWVEQTADGGVVFYGEFGGTIELEEGFPQTSSDHDGFIARYDASGNHLWHVTVASPAHEVVSDLAIDPGTGAIVAVVQYESVIQDPAGTTLPHAGLADMLLLKLDASGNPIFSQPFGSANDDWINAVDVDANGRIAIAGELVGGAVDFGDGLKPLDDGTDTFVAVFEPDGTLAWSDRFEGPGEQWLRQLAYHRPSGDIILAGAVISGSASFGGPPFSGENVGVFSRLGPANNYVEGRSVQNFTTPRAMATDAEANTYVAGPFGGTIDFGGNPLASAGGQDGIVAKLGPKFEHIWSIQFGSLAADNVWAVDVDDAGNVFVGAYFQGETTIDGCGALTSAGGADVVLMKIDR